MKHQHPSIYRTEYFVTSQNSYFKPGRYPLQKATRHPAKRGSPILGKARRASSERKEGKRTHGYNSLVMPTLITHSKIECRSAVVSMPKLQVHLLPHQRLGGGEVRIGG
jgi:hypothetical protein